jgi:hypothetical protein
MHDCFSTPSWITLVKLKMSYEFLLFLSLTKIRWSTRSGECGKPTGAWGWAQCWWLPNERWECARWWLPISNSAISWWRWILIPLSRKCLSSHRRLSLFSNGVSLSGLIIQRSLMPDILIPLLLMEATWLEATWTPPVILEPKPAVTCVKFQAMYSGLFRVLTFVKTVLFFW